MPLIEYKDRHELPDDDAVAIFDHMNRTGGVTLSELLYRHYDPHDPRTVLRTFGHAAHTDYRAAMANPENIRFIDGHAARGSHLIFPERRKSFYFTLLRHPFRQWISIYKGSAPRDNPENTRRFLEYHIYASPENRIIAWLGNGDAALAEQKLFEQYAFFGITELLAESVYGLSGLLPFLKNEKSIHNTNMAPKDAVAVGAVAEEYFMEKNAKDMELYERAVKEFKKRVPVQLSPIEVRTDDMSFYSRPELYARSAPAIVESLCRMEYVSPRDVFRLYAALEISGGGGGVFFAISCKKHDLAEYKYFEFLDHAKLRNESGMNICANYIFDTIDRFDKKNRITALVDFRFEILRQFFQIASDVTKLSFFEKCRDWHVVSPSDSGIAGKRASCRSSSSRKIRGAGCRAGLSEKCRRHALRQFGIS